MAKREMIVVGGSAGSLQSLKTVLSALPGNLGAAVVVITHLRARQESLLAQNLAPVCRLSVLPAAEGQRIERGKVVQSFLWPAR